MTTNNPLLDFSSLPRFESINPKHVEPALNKLLDEGRSLISQLEQRNSLASWNNFVTPLEDVHDRLERMWSPVSHLNGVKDNPELRAVYDKALVSLSNYYTDVGQNESLYRGFEEIQASEKYQDLNEFQHKIVDNSLRDFRLGGVALDASSKTRYREIAERLSVLGNTFGKNVLDATDEWSMTLTDSADVAGIPATALQQAENEARQAGESGWRFTLKAPSFIPFMTYAKSREQRFRLYQAYVTRASDTGPHNRDHDNGELMAEILKLRHEKASLLGFDNYATYSLQTKMAKSVDEVEAFLVDLVEKCRPAAQREISQLNAFAKDELAMEDLQAWDMAYCAEKLKLERFDIDQEELRPWFPLPGVLDGLFSVVNRLFGITVTPAKDVETWDSDILVFDIKDQHGTHRGCVYMDLIARDGKRGGAWMAECISRKRLQTGIQSPVAFLVCNFPSATEDRPSLLSHDDVTTLFHEFGHSLQHMLTLIDYSEISGINGVPWDAVELPSQFLENWCWERQGLDLISGHFQTAEKLPDEMLNKLKAGKNFQSAMILARQLEFALFDMRLHRQSAQETSQLNSASIQTVLDKVREEVAVVIPPEFNRFQNSFSHIFAGGYAAGYYSYLWAEVLSSDAFSLFEENGIFDQQTGKLFMQYILEPGGSKDPQELFTKFRGRGPKIDALLVHRGLQ
ncbi:MAG: oligopeptidase A [Parasphingorhabdus sp.]|jgi:oligopeptidase A